MGFELFERPDDADGIPELPDDLTAISDQELMGLFTQYVSWQDYAATQKVLAEIEEDDAATALDIAKASVTKVPEGVKSRDPVGALIKATITSDPAVQEADDIYRQVVYSRKLLGAITDSLERRAALVSRELTRRTNSEPNNRRTQRWGS